MQKVQILHGSPEPTFVLTSAAAARSLALEKILRPNLITNGDCEADANWASYGTPAANARDQTKVMTGDYSRLFTPNAANEGIQSDVLKRPTVTGDRYRYTVWVFPDDGTIASIIIRQGDNLANLYDKVHTGLTENAWNEINIEVVELGGGAGAYLVVHSGAQVSGDFYVTNIFASQVKQKGQHSGRRATRLLITVDSDEIRWATGGATPTQGALGHMVYPVTATNPHGQIVLQSFDAIKTFQYITNNANEHGKLSVNVEF